MMTDEEKTVSKLKGENCLIKFKDGEELVLRVDFGDEDTEGQWFIDMELFINGIADIEFCQIPGIAVTRDSIKYVKKI